MKSLVIHLCGGIRKRSCRPGVVSKGWADAKHCQDEIKGMTKKTYVERKKSRLS